MKKVLSLGAVSVIALMLAAPVFAQGAVTGTTALNDQIDDLERTTAKELARSNDASRFGNPEYRQGTSGSVSLAYSGQTGNTVGQELAFGGRLRHANGNFVQTLGFSLDYAEAAGTVTKQTVFAVYEGAYYFNDRFYGFGLARGNSNALATGTDYKTDAFVGFGPGYRIVNNEKMTWRVGVGIGASYLENAAGTKTSEVGYLGTSRFFYKINDRVFLTNDTDVLASKSATRVSNDFGVNFKITDAFQTRASYLTEYNSTSAKTDNKIGVALVYGF